MIHQKLNHSNSNCKETCFNLPKTRFSWPASWCSATTPVRIQVCDDVGPILLTKVFYILTNLAGFINKHSPMCPVDTLKVWALLLHPSGWSSAMYIAIWPISPRTPPSILKARSLRSITFDHMTIMDHCGIFRSLRLLR